MMDFESNIMDSESNMMDVPTVSKRRINAIKAYTPTTTTTTIITIIITINIPISIIIIFILYATMAPVIVKIASKRYRFHVKVARNL